MTEEIESQQDAQIAGRTIDRVVIRKLYGHYSYDLALRPNDSDGRLAIFYGENGSGKTSVLQLVFHLLSAAPERGHRSYLARTPFEKVRVEFSDGSVVWAERPNGNLDGAYEIAVEVASHEPLIVPVTPARGGGVSEDGNPGLVGIERALSSLGSEIWLIADDRRVYSDALEESEEDQQDWILAGHEGPFFAPHRRERKPDIEIAMERARQWLNRRVLSGSRRAAENSNSIYAEVVKRIAGTASETPTEVYGKDYLRGRIRELSVRVHERGSLALVPALPATDLLETIDGANEQSYNVIESVLRPYLDGIDARLDAVEATAETIRAFVDHVNSSYRGKSIKFTNRGITIQTQFGERLAPTALSSGERHLLLLMCNVLAVSDSQAIFMIDEPELSLNIRWQRQFIDALHSIANPITTQFILATHSFELLSRYDNLVVRLEPELDPPPLPLEFAPE